MKKQDFTKKIGFNFATCTQQIDNYLSSYQPHHSSQRHLMSMLREACRVAFDGSSKTKSGTNRLKLNRKSFATLLGCGLSAVKNMFNRLLHWRILVEDKSARKSLRDQKSYFVNIVQTQTQQTKCGRM